MKKVDAYKLLIPYYKIGIIHTNTAIHFYRSVWQISDLLELIGRYYEIKNSLR